MFERLREIRMSKGITCEMMAKALGLQTKSAYSKKELGRTPFSLADAKIISDTLGYSIEEIFFDNEVS